ncbi:MAG: outer membrane protein transport protein [Kiritimatiellae bacterium]|nr:outer membrane protein transport protein [Kiritimatiellia bacterium]
MTKDLSLGVVYRSRINHRIRGDFEMDGSGDLQTYSGKGDANAKLVLPASVVLGANYEFNEDFRGGVSLTWTEWSTINHIDFNLPFGQSRTQKLNWHDAWRIGFGFEYDFTNAFTGRIGYSYDWDPSSEAHGTTMLPPGDRHLVGFGAGYRFNEDWRIDLGYSFILMESETRMIEGARFQCDNSYSHIVSASVTYTF